MSDIEEATVPLLPLATKTLRLMPNDIVPAVEDSPYVVHFTMAALDPLAPVDKKQNPSTLRILRIPEESADDEEDEDEESDEEEDTEPVTLLTLSPSTKFQQSIDVYVAPTESLCFQVIGSYPIHLTGNIVDHPMTAELIAEAEEAEEDEDEDEEEEEDDEEDIPDAIDIEAADDAGSDEDELDDDEDDSEDDSEDEEVEVDVEESEDDSEEEPRIQEIPEPKKRNAEEPAAPQDKKKVKFSAALEQGPTPTKFPTQKLEGNVVIEDRKAGEGPSAKRGSRVSMRYVGKLANGKVFDKNTSGRPFAFSLGRGEVIRGWDIGIAGMKAGGERRIIIPAPMAYGKQSLPGIPKNSELRFDVKCLSIK